MKIRSMKHLQAEIHSAGVPVRVAKFGGQYLFFSRGIVTYTGIRSLWWGDVGWWADHARYALKTSTEFQVNVDWKQESHVPGNPVM